MIENRQNTSNNLFDLVFQADRIVIINYSILLFFLVFGTGLPWREKSELYYQESSDGNLVNQILFIFLFLSSLTVILPQINNIWSFVKKEKYLAFFVGICIISIIWSFDSFVTLKRSFEIFILYLVAVTSILYCNSVKLLKITRIIFTIYLVVSLFVCLTVPAAIDPNFGTWRGIHDNKNGLAQMGVLSLLVSFLFYHMNKNTVKSIWNYLISLSSSILIIMAGSSTAIIILVLLILTGLIMKIEKIFGVIHINRFFLLFILGFFLVTAIFFFFFFRAEFSYVAGLFGKDLTLTGRTLFWPTLFRDFRDHFILGYGYDAFWIMGSSHVNKLFFENSIRVNTAHNGFLDLAIQLGMTGILMIIFIFYSFVKRALKSYDNIALLALISIFITNLTESTLFQPKSITTFIFMFFYLRTAFLYFNLKSDF